MEYKLVITHLPTGTQWITSEVEFSKDEIETLKKILKGNDAHLDYTLEDGSTLILNPHILKNCSIQMHKTG